VQDEPLAVLADHPLVAGSLVPRSGRGLIVPLRYGEPTEVERVTGSGDVAGEPAAGTDGAGQLDAQPPPLEVALPAAARHALANRPALSSGLTGFGEIIEAQREAFATERWRLQGLGALLGFVVAAAAFRRIGATFLAGLPPLFGAVVSLGIARLLGLGGDGFTVIVLPLLVLTIGFTDALHVVVAAAREARRAQRVHGSWGTTAAERGATLARAVAELAWPCFLTSLTTAVGFSSLAMARNPMVRDFGWSCALGTAVTFVCVLSSLPLLGRTGLARALPHVRPPTFDASHGEFGQGDGRGMGPAAGAARGNWAARAVGHGLELVLRAPRTLASIGVALLVALALTAARLEPDRRAATDLADGSEAVEVLRRVDVELGGAFPVQVRLRWDEHTRLDVVVAAARVAREALASEPLVEAGLGLDSVVDTFTLARPGLAAFDAAVLGLLPAQWTAPVVDLAGRQALLHARVPDVGSAALVPRFAALEEALAARLPSGVTASVTGLHVAYLRSVRELAGDLARSLALAGTLILITIGTAFRSVRLGLVSVLPNVLPLAAAAAGLALGGGELDISALTALTLSLGIATDDTIHVLTRWQAARAAGRAPVDAARFAVLHSLPALALTTVTLSAAFGLLLTSSLPTLRTFGLLSATTLVAAFVADVWLLPAMLVAFSGLRRGATKDPTCAAARAG
jgi:predicted RND superfamily exporter protein